MFLKESGAWQVLNHGYPSLADPRRPLTAFALVAVDSNQQGVGAFEVLEESNANGHARQSTGLRV